MGVEPIKVKVEYHREGMFYTVRGKRLKELRSLQRMREKIMAVTNADWKWHIVITFDGDSLNYWFRQYGSVGKALTMYFNKVREKLWGMKYFWKYEEGTKVWCHRCKERVDFVYDKKRKGWVFCEKCGLQIKGGERPHYLILFDFVNRSVKGKESKMEQSLKKIKKKNVKRIKLKNGVVNLIWCENEITEIDAKKLVFPHNWDKVNWNEWFNDQKSYKMNRGKTNLEILMGFYHKQKWGNGIVFARKLRGYYDLKEYVKKDFYKYTEARYLKRDSKKWRYSLNLEFDKNLKPQGKWVKVLETIGNFEPSEALRMVKSSKENMIDYYNERGLVGNYIYERVIGDITDLKSSKVGSIVNTGQEKLNVDVIGTTKCRCCGIMFDVDKGFVGIYCSKKCFNTYSRSMEFKLKKKFEWDKK